MQWTLWRITKQPKHDCIFQLSLCLSHVPCHLPLPFSLAQEVDLHYFINRALCLCILVGYRQWEASLGDHREQGDEIRVLGSTSILDQNYSDLKTATYPKFCPSDAYDISLISYCIWLPIEFAPFFFSFGLKDVIACYYWPWVIAVFLWFP